MSKLSLFSKAMVAACSIWAFSAAAQDVTIPKRLTLAKAKRISMMHNPNLETTIARIKAAMARIEQARAAYLPSVDLIADAKRMLHNAREDKSYSITNPYGRFSTELEATYTLYDGLARKYKMLLEEQNREIADANHIDVQRQLLLSVASAYYEAMLERQNVIINIDDYNYNKKLQDQAEKKLKHGTGTKSDVLNFEIQAKNAESSRMVSELNYNVGILALIELLGCHPEEIPEGIELEEVKDYLKATPILDYETLCDYALLNRPDLKASILTIKQKETQADIYRADYRPKFTAYAAYGFARRHDAKLGNDNREAYVGVQMSWNIFNGLQTNAQIAETLAQRLEEEANRKTLVLSIKHDISQQMQTIDQAKKLADLKFETQELAMQARDLVQKEYDIGRVTSTRLNEAQNDYTNAQGDYVKAVINYWLYRQNLEATTGTILNFD